MDVPHFVNVCCRFTEDTISLLEEMLFATFIYQKQVYVIALHNITETEFELKDMHRFVGNVHIEIV